MVRYLVDMSQGATLPLYTKHPESGYALTALRSFHLREENETRHALNRLTLNSWPPFFASAYVSWAIIERHIFSRTKKTRDLP